MGKLDTIGRGAIPILCPKPKHLQFPKLPGLVSEKDEYRKKRGGMRITVNDIRKKVDERSIEELRAFMEKAAAPEFRFEFVPGQPLRVSVERRVIYIGREVLREAVAEWVKRGWDWRRQLSANVKHEKGHLRTHPYRGAGVARLDPKQLREAGISREELTSLVSFLEDYVIDFILYGEDAEYQRVMRRDMAYAYEEYAKMTRFRRREMLKLVSPYHTVSYYLAVGIVGWDRAKRDFSEQRAFIREYADLMRRLKSEKDLEWAIPEAVEIRKRFWGSSNKD